MGKRIDLADPETAKRRMARYGITIEIAASATGYSPTEINDILNVRRIVPLRLSVFLSLFSGSSTDSRAAVMRVLEEATEPNPIEWRIIPGFSRYEVSSEGHVRRGTGGPGSKPGHILKQKRSPYGHLSVTLYDDEGRQATLGCHRCVTLAFVGMPPPGKPFACHRDGIADHNVPENLYWGSHADNTADMVKHAAERQLLVENSWTGTDRLTRRQLYELKKTHQNSNA